MRAISLFLIGGLVGLPASAAEPGVSGLPTKPTAPPTLVHKTREDLFHCQRRFTYDGRVLNCDSNLYQDGEGLRPILEATPAALSELNIYQSNRRKVSTLAYTGSAGLGLALAALIASRFMTDSGGTTASGRAVRNVGGFAGILIAGGSLIYGITTLRNNEDHLVRAVELHNDFHPNKRIEIQLSAGVATF